MRAGFGAPGRRERRIALWAFGVSSLIVAIVAPFATTPLAPVPAVMPAYEGWSILSALIMAILLFSQFTVIRSRGLYVLACGCLFTALAALARFWVTPVDIMAESPLGVSSDTTFWFFLFWTLGLPAMAIVYTLQRGAQGLATGMDDRRVRLGNSFTVGLGIVGVVALLASLWGLTVVARPWLAPLVTPTGFSPLAKLIACGVIALALAALVAVSLRKPRTMLDGWLILSLGGWLVQFVLSGVLSRHAYDVGWYAGLAYGTAGSCLLAVALAFEHANQHRRLFEMHSALLASNQALDHLSRHDALTGLPNRRYFDAHVAQQASVMRRHKRCMAIVLFDVDHFKSFNDKFGHQAGDECLAQIAEALQSCCRRPADLASRYGGEEFAFVLPETDLSSAMSVAQSAREAVARLRIPQAPNSTWPFVTISGGVAVYDGPSGLSTEDVIAAADEALFQAKSRGRNKIISQSFERPASAERRLHAV